MALVVTEPPVLYLARQQKPLDDFPMPRLFKWFLLWIYDRYGFAGNGCECGRYCSFEDRGVFISEADARWAANCKGGSYKPIPLNAALPEETCRFGIHDFPQSENSHAYRRRRLPYSAVPTSKVELLNSIITERN